MTDRSGDDEELAELVGEFSSRRTYRPTDDLAEPEEMPPAASGAAMGDAGGTGSAGGEPATP
ncbi:MULTISPECIES: hypothetical protein [Streptomyces]|uniref:Uncharacterized protein n=1 Tax=Streptomyces yunnanensis TaxID=156453 RepID=A0ABY8A0E4_9ACTN|nr:MULTISPECIES: hypothetical protein [Streptomyces]AJC53376.1 hypothetical protein GZL_00772 [Streptomyces sp. 769]WEB38407.1 hypothetical protein MOV08_03175 [Streptomyces yunnanensis]